MGGRRDSADDGTRRLGISFAICAPAGRPARPPQPAHPSSRICNSAPVLTARLRAGYRWPIGSRAAGAAFARQELLQRQAAPEETLGSSKEGASRRAADSAAVDLGPTGRFDRRRQPFLVRLTAGGGCAARPKWEIRCVPREERSPAVTLQRARAVRSQPLFAQAAPPLHHHGKLLLWLAVTSQHLGQSIEPCEHRPARAAEGSGGHRRAPVT